MVLPASPVIFDRKTPEPEPSMVLLFAMVGFEAVCQHTPRAVMPCVPSVDTSPPQVAVLAVILYTEDVFTVISLLLVVNFFCSPYTVPLALVAYART